MFTLLFKPHHLIVGALGAGLVACGGAVLEWSIQDGTASSDAAYDVAVNRAGDIYLTGTTGSTRDNTEQNIFLAKYNDQGQRTWFKQFGTELEDYAYAMALDSRGNPIVAGAYFVDGSIVDAMVRKFDANGNQLWMQTLASTDEDWAYDVAVDSSDNIYITGETFEALPGNTYLGGRDLLLAKYDSAGNRVWAKQFGTSGFDYGYGIVVTPGNELYVVGNTDGALPGYPENEFAQNHLLLAKFDADGNQIWMKQYELDSADAQGRKIALDSKGNLVVAGSVFNRSKGDDALIAKFSPQGDLIWQQTLSGNASEFVYGLVLDSADNAYITGETYSGLSGLNKGYADIFFAKYNTNGAQLWVTQAGTNGFDSGTNLALNADRTVLMSGATTASYAPYANKGERDYLLFKIDEMGVLK